MAWTIGPGCQGARKATGCLGESRYRERSREGGNPSGVNGYIALRNRYIVQGRSHTRAIERGSIVDGLSVPRSSDEA